MFPMSMLASVLWQQNLKFSFHQQTVEFGPTHIFTQRFVAVEKANKEISVILQTNQLKRGVANRGIENAFMLRPRLRV